MSPYVAVNYSTLHCMHIAFYCATRKLNYIPLRYHELGPYSKMINGEHKQPKNGKLFPYLGAGRRQIALHARLHGHSSLETSPSRLLQMQPPAAALRPKVLRGVEGAQAVRAAQQRAS